MAAKKVGTEPLIEEFLRLMATAQMPDLMLQTVSHEVTPTNYLSPSPFQGR
jgi:hypothetical protein